MKKQLDAGYNGTSQGATQASVYSPPASPADDTIESEDESSGGGFPSGAFVIPTFNAGDAPRQSNAPSGTNANAIAMASIKKVLGARFEPMDGPGYQQLLKNSFKLTAIEGRREATWTPASWGGLSNPSALEGAEAVFYAHVESTVTRLKGELRRMEKLSRAGLEKPDVCCEDIREVLSSKLEELVRSMAITGEPCVERVTAGFTGLQNLLDLFEEEYIGNDPTGNGTEICCPEDARRLAQCRVFVDGIETLETQWKNFADQFLSANGGASVAATLKRARLQLQVIASTVHDIICGLAHAGWGKPVLELEPVKSGGPTVGGILRWIKDFADRAMVGLRSPGRGGFQMLASEATTLGGYVQDLSDWVNGTVVAELPSQVANLRDAREKNKVKEAQDDLTKIGNDLAELRERMKEKEAALQAMREAQERTQQPEKKYGAETKAAGEYGKSKTTPKEEEKKRAAYSEFEKNRKVLQDELNDMTQQQNALLERKVECEGRISKAAQAIPPAVQAAVSGLQCVMLGIPAAVGILKKNLLSFAGKMTRLSDNCAPPAGPARKKHPRKKAYRQDAIPAAGQEEGEDEAAEYGDGYDPGPGEKSYGSA